MSLGKIQPKFNNASLNREIPYQELKENPAFMATNTSVLSNQTNHTLYLKELRPYITQSKLTKIFQPYKGFREVRHIPEKGVAFVEFDNDAQATSALIGLSNYRFEDGHTLNLSYARKQN